MASSNDFRNGMALRVDGNLVTIVEFQHVKPGKGGAFVRQRLRITRARRSGCLRAPHEHPQSSKTLPRRKLKYIAAA
jgi:translation elongation factor P/translation initiation factor 5A